MLQHTCERCLLGVNLPTLQITAQINAQKNTEAAWQIRPQIGFFFLLPLTGCGRPSFASRRRTTQSERRQSAEIHPEI